MKNSGSNVKTVLLLLSLCLVWGGVGCTEPKAPAVAQVFQGTHPIQVTVTVGMVADLVRAIGGDHVQVQQLMGATVDPHLYKPTRDDTAALLGADIIFYNGLMLEGKMAETLKNFSHRRRTVPVAEVLDLHEDGQAAAEAHPDPHVWMNVAMWSQVAQGIGDELARFDPQHQADYQTASKKLRTQLQALHQYGVEAMQGVPEGHRVLVTSHDAFRYFGEAYGVEVQAVQGISTESEAGLSRINELVDMLVARKITSVFIESSVPKESIEALLRGAASRQHQVEIAGSLYSDAMGPEGTYEGTYIGMMDHNLSTIARALGSAQVPDNGFQGYAADVE
ncbi:metal ABC transporter solute-binding protein, Zn/Mn family [Aureliella helgolandensis]|uniref:Periplasmic zinc-binding protein TroA n=1 Tax=Aureliella helgolandensis TaxID=2527968 RepID=A0A518G033_9BACT|nr:zinc ABC transporter substrate-binding protein [Aureliella helgolandensis]QDV21959.1 Periplasmic zinc-binding protein TroA precursor [Aureliella helgolandensis]